MTLLRDKVSIRWPDIAYTFYYQVYCVLHKDFGGGLYEVVSHVHQSERFDRSRAGETAQEAVKMEI